MIILYLQNIFPFPVLPVKGLIFYFRQNFLMRHFFIAGSGLCVIVITFSPLTKCASIKTLCTILHGRHVWSIFFIICWACKIQNSLWSSVNKMQTLRWWSLMWICMSLVVWSNEIHLEVSGIFWALKVCKLYLIDTDLYKRTETWNWGCSWYLGTMSALCSMANSGVKSVFQPCRSGISK